MAYTPNPTVVNNFKISGDYRIDALIYADNSRWNVASAAGTPVTLTYSFMTAVPSYGGNTSTTDSNFYVFNAAQQQATLAVLNEISTASGIVFFQKTDDDYMTAFAFPSLRASLRSDEDSSELWQTTDLYTFNSVRFFLWPK